MHPALRKGPLYTKHPLFSTFFYKNHPPHFPLLQNTSIFHIFKHFKTFLQPPQFHFLPTGLRSEYFVWLHRWKLLLYKRHFYRASLAYIRPVQSAILLWWFVRLSVPLYVTRCCCFELIVKQSSHHKHCHCGPWILSSCTVSNAVVMGAVSDELA